MHLTLLREYEYGTGTSSHHHVSGINSIYLFINLILVPVPPFPTHLFFHPSLLLIHNSADP